MTSRATLVQKVLLLAAAIATLFLLYAGAALMVERDRDALSNTGSSLVDWVAPRPALAAEASTFTVNSKGDDADASAGDGSCATSQNACTLRAAIEEANLHSGADTIAFNIPGTGVQTITLNSNLPEISDTSGPTTIDGYTQPGSSANTDPSVSNAAIMVEVAANAFPDSRGLYVTSPGNTIRGLALFKMKEPITLYGSDAHDNTIAGNFVGTNAAGSYGAGAKKYPGDGITVRSGAQTNTVGGTSAADRNVVSGNSFRGMTLFGETTKFNRIINNIVGLGPAGDKALPNRQHGIDLNVGASQNQVGGTGEGERNVVSGNSSNGVEVSHEPTTVENKVVGNFIGTNTTGKTGPAYARNSQWGVYIEDHAGKNEVVENVIGNSGLGGVGVGDHATGTVIEKNRIGVSLDGTSIPNGTAGVRIDGGSSGSRVGPNNVISNNGQSGVRIVDVETDGHTITGNSIYDNQGLGIDLNPLGSPNPNDASDGDSGPNQQLNFPVIVGASPEKVSGSACGGCTVEVFLADGGAGAYGEGKTFVGSATANSSGGFAATVSGVAEGNHLTTTATDTAGNTSEFSPNQVVAATADTTAPIAQPPTQSFAANSTLGTSTVPVKLTWSATDDESGVSEYRLQQSTNGGAFTTVSISTTSTSKTVLLSPGNTYQFRTMAKDTAGNWSDWVNGPQFTVSDHQETSSAVSYVGTWTTEALSSAYGGSVNHAATKVDRAQFSFTGSSVTWVAPKNADRGKATVWIDGVKVGTVDLYSSAEQPRKMIFTKNGLDASQTHTLEVRVLGQKRTASSGTRVDVDAFAVLSSP